MPVEMLTYAQLGERLTISPEAARALVKRHRWPRSRSNDGKTLVQVDLTEISHSPIARAPQVPAGQQQIAALKQKIESLQAELIEAKTIASGHRADFERECERTNKLLAELLRATSDSSDAREKPRYSKESYRCCRSPGGAGWSMPSPLPCRKLPATRRKPPAASSNRIIEPVSRTADSHQWRQREVPASAPVASMMSMVPVVTMSCSPPTIARVGISAPVVLAVCVRIELCAPARIGNDVLRRRRPAEGEQP